MAKKRNNNNNRQRVVVQNVSRRRASGKKPKVVARTPFNNNRPYFDPGSNGLLEKMRGLSTSAASGLGSQMMGSTGNPYLDTLADPHRGPCRIPDEYSRPTAVHQSFKYFTMTSSAVTGQGAVIMNPIFGDGTTLSIDNRWIETFEPDTPASSFIDDPDLSTFVTGTNPQVDGVRPISASMLASYIGDTLSDGGQISAVWLPGDTPPARVQALIAGGVDLVSQVPGAYTGPLSKGAYVFWKPDDIGDFDFKTPTKQLTHDYPKLLIVYRSTQLAKTILRISAVLNHEITTSKRVLETEVGLIEPSLMLHAKKVLALYPSASANDGHVSLWQKIMQGAKDFFLTIGESFRNLFAPSVSAVATDLGNLASNPGVVQLARAASQFGSPTMNLDIKDS